MESITSLKNPLIRELSKLSVRKNRVESGFFLVEGVRLVAEAIASKAPIARLVADEKGIADLLTVLDRQNSRMHSLSGEKAALASQEEAVRRGSPGDYNLNYLHEVGADDLFCDEKSRGSRQKARIYGSQQEYRAGDTLLEAMTCELDFDPTNDLLEMLLRYPKNQPILVATEVLAKICDTKSPQGIVAVVKLPESAYYNQNNSNEFLRNITTRRVLALERLQDPGNLGTIIRAAAACGFSTVVVSADSADPWQPKVLRSTMGSIWHVDVLITDSISELLCFGKRLDYRVLTSHPRGTTPCWGAQLADNIIIAIGNEAAGLSEEVLALADEKVQIPMREGVESLNAAVSASVLMYESMRQRAIFPA